MRQICLQHVLLLCMASAVCSKNLIDKPQFISPSRKLTVASLQESSRAIVEHEHLNAANSESATFTSNTGHAAPVSSSLGENTSSHHEESSGNAVHSINSLAISSIANRDAVLSDSSSPISSPLSSLTSGGPSSVSIDSSVDRFPKPILTVDQPISSHLTDSIEPSSGSVPSASGTSTANAPASSASFSSSAALTDHSGLPNNIDVSNTHYQTLNQPAVATETGEINTPGADSAAYTGLKTRQPNVGNKLLPLVNAPYQPTYAIYNPQTGTYTPYAYPSVAFAQQPAYAPVIYAPGAYPNTGYLHSLPSGYPSVNYPPGAYPMPSISGLPTAANYPNFGFAPSASVVTSGQSASTNKPNEPSSSLVGNIISHIPFIGYNPISYVFGSRSPQSVTSNPNNQSPTANVDSNQLIQNQQPSYVYPNPVTGYFEPVYGNPAISQPMVQSAPAYPNTNNAHYGSPPAADSPTQPAQSLTAKQIPSAASNSPSLVQRIGGFFIRPITFFTSGTSSTSQAASFNTAAASTLSAAPKEAGQIIPNHYAHVLPSESYDLTDLPANEQYHAPSRHYARSMNAPITLGSSVYPQPISMPQYAISHLQNHHQDQSDVNGRHEAAIKSAPSKSSARRSGH